MNTQQDSVFLLTNRLGRIVLLAAALLAVLSIFTIFGPVAVAEDTLPKLQPVPKAQCRPTDQTESFQGETTLAERFRPGPPQSYHCNLKLVGQYTGEGSGDIFRTYQHFAYVGVFKNADTKHPGVMVLDVSDPLNPKPTAYLETPTTLTMNEALEISAERKLMFIVNDVGLFDVYDLSKDPSQPTLLSTGQMPGAGIHMGEFSRDGYTFFGAVLGAGLDPNSKVPPSAIFAIDLTDPAHPKILDTWIPEDASWKTHSVRLSEDGNRAYIATFGGFFEADPSNEHVLAILDVSDFQAKKANPKIRLVSTLGWGGTDIGTEAGPITIDGKPYLAYTDSTGTLQWSPAGPPPAEACIPGKPAFGFTWLIDISDETKPKLTSGLMLEAQSPERCNETRLHPFTGLGYGALFCDADNPQDTKLLACGHWESGVRVFDVRDPTQPKEVAYYKPPAVRTEPRPGALQFLPFMPGAKDRTADVTLAIKFRNAGREIWFNSWDNGFQVLHFDDDFVKSRPDLFSK